METTGKTVPPSLGESNHEKITNALSQYGKRTVLADKIDTSPGNLSKISSGNLRVVCKMLDELGLEIQLKGYTGSIEALLVANMGHIEHENTLDDSYEEILRDKLNSKNGKPDPEEYFKHLERAVSEHMPSRYSKT